MGQEIFYCDGCKSLVRSAELEKGKAFRVGDRVFCLKCAPAPAPRPRGRGETSAFHKAINAPPSTRRTVAAAPSSTTPWILAGVGAALLAVIVAVAAGSSSRPPEEKPKDGPAAPLVVIPDRPAPPPPRPAPPPPTPSREDQARALLREAQAYAAEHPQDLAGQESRARRAALEAEGTLLADEARRFLETLRARSAAALEAEIAPLLDRGAYGEALEKLDAAGARERAETVRGTARRAFPSIRDRALAAKRSNAQDEVKRVEAEVGRWGLPDLSSELQAALAVRNEPAPPPPPAAGPWPVALGAAAARDYPAALQALGPGEDAELLRAAGAVLSESLQILAKWPRGQKLATDYLDLGGERRQVDDPVVRTTAAWAEVKREKGSSFVEFSEILPGSLAAIWLKRAAKPEPRSAALFLLVEGDAAAAEKLVPKASLPEKYWAWAASRSASPRDLEARRLFAEAERLWVPFSSRGESTPTYKALLSEFADTEFVRRRRTLLASRSDAPREYVFEADDLAAAGGFRLTSEKSGACWSMTAESGTVEAEFWVPAGLEFRAWAYVGACCAESAPFALQGTDLADAVLKPRSTPATRSHAGHSGKKPALSWSWTPLPLPRYAEGRKKIRLSSEHAGFSVASIVVSALREAPPSEAELKEIARLRAENPPALRLGSRSLYRAFNLNGPPVTIDGNLWEGKGAKDLSHSGEGFDNQAVPLTPRADGDRALMIRSSIWSKDGTTVTVRGVPPGTYQVHLTVWEDNNPQTFDLFVNGRPVQSRYCSGAGGHWDRLGPWTVEVADGAIEVRASAADANFSGLELWRLNR